MKRKHRRLSFVFLGLGLLGVASLLILSAIEEKIVFFKSPSELVEEPPAEEQRLRVGGLVEEGSVVRGDGTTIEFRVTDLANVVPVRYTGILPDLFREGQGVVAEGHMQGGTFVADEVLAKHDENYMPPEVADALKASGQWQHLQTTLQDPAQAQGNTPR